MNEYITKSAAIAAIGHHQCDYLNNCYEQDCLAIANLPAADVVLVVHAHWINLGKYSDGYNWRCSSCKRESIMAINYCPSCGAKMDTVFLTRAEAEAALKQEAKDNE